MSFFKQLIFYLYRLGVPGLAYFLRKKFKEKNELISIRPKSIKHHIHLRNKTSDISCFNDIFFDHPYLIKVDFEPKTIIDLGANIGLASIYFKNQFPKAAIYAVEPEAGNFKQLELNLSEYNGIHCYHKGIWHQSAHLKISELSSGAWGFIVEEVPEATEDTVEAISIDDIIKDHNLESIDILKVDIEGSELELFSKNFDSWLPKVKMIIIEFHDSKRPNTSKTFFKALEGYDYSIEPKGENFICKLNNLSSAH